MGLLEFGKGLKAEITATGKIRISANVKITEYRWFKQGITAPNGWTKTDIKNGYTLIIGDSEGESEGEVLSHTHTDSQATITAFGNVNGNFGAGKYAKLWINMTTHQYKWTDIKSILTGDWEVVQELKGMTISTPRSYDLDDVNSVGLHQHHWSVDTSQTFAQGVESSLDASYLQEWSWLEFITDFNNNASDSNFLGGISADLYQKTDYLDETLYVGEYSFWETGTTGIDSKWIKQGTYNQALISNQTEANGFVQAHQHQGKVQGYKAGEKAYADQYKSALYYRVEISGTTNQTGNQMNVGASVGADLYLYMPNGLVDIEIANTSVTLNQNNEWSHLNTISNYNELVNPKVLKNWTSGDVTSHFVSGGVNTSLVANYQNNWIIQGDDTCLITADNAKQPITLKLANPGCEGRIGICAIEYQYGSENNGNNSCGGVEIRNIDGAGTYRLAGETTNIAIWRDTSVNPVRMFISPDASTHFPSNIETWVTSTYQGWNYLTPKVNIGEVIKDSSNPNCTVTTCGFTSFLDNDCQCGKHKS